MREFKVGDKVVLRPETKPYTFTNQPCSYSEIKVELPENITYMVDYIHSDGDIYIISNCWRGHITHPPKTCRINNKGKRRV